MTDAELKSIYEEFLSNKTILGIGVLLKSKGFGSKQRIRIRRALYDSFGEEKIKKISQHRVASVGAKSRTGYRHSTRTKKKIRKSNKRSWEKTPDRRKLSRQLMVKYCAPKSQTKDAIRNRVNSRKGYRHSQQTIAKIRKSNIGRKLSEQHKSKLRKSRIRKGVPHSVRTKRKLSKITKSQWKKGIHKTTYKSKGQLEVIRLLRELGYAVRGEYIVDGRPFDAYIRKKNLLIEFNGTYWHRDPRVEKYRVDPTSKLIWENDKNKIDNAKKLGYDVRVIWQNDWESCRNKQKYLQQIL